MTTPASSDFHQHKDSAQLKSDNRASTSNAFTLVELLGVIAIIGILAGLTLGGAGAVRRHGATSQAKSEIAALQTACERYYGDNGAYPTNSASDNTACSPDAKNFNPTTSVYTRSCAVLFSNLVGSSTISNAPTTKRYFEPKPSMVSGTYFIDPWGYSYGYYSDGTNAPFIWSTAGQTTSAGTNKWITSWPKM